MKKFLSVLLLAGVTLTSFAAKEWFNVTDRYISNPRFENNDIKTGWQGTELGAFNPFENAEHYNKNYDTYQTLTGLTPGKYRVSLSAFYRMGSADNDYSLYEGGNYSGSQNAILYAKTASEEKTKAILPASSAALEESLGGDASAVSSSSEWWWWSTTYYIPNNMEAAHYWFEEGKYKNTVECEVGEDGILTIGIRKTNTINEDWTCIDNWTLEYESNVQEIQLSESAVTMVTHQVFNLTATALPINAPYSNLTWTTSDKTIAIVDAQGLVSAVSEGTCIITAKSKKDSTKKAECTITVSGHTDIANSLIINEIMAANVDVYLDPSFNYGSWVELYNPNNMSISLGGLYVTDDPNNLTKHRLIDSYGALPAKGFAILNFDHHEIGRMASYRQIDDKLDCDGGTIIISDGTKILAQQDYPPAISRVSYARTADGGTVWGMTGNPSPGTSNQANGGFAASQLEAPIVDKDPQRFASPMVVSVNVPAGATLKYTTDGTTPTLTNGETSSTGLFNVSNTTCYRFRLFKEGFLPSPVVTRSYIYDSGEYPFPIISVVTDDNNIYSQEYGVFEQGPNGRPGNGQTANCNWNMDWDRPVAFDYITTDNKCLISQECNFATCGGWSRAWNPKSFKLKADKIFDFNNFFQAQFFDEKPYIKNKTLQIRNGGNDTSCRIKDAALQQIAARSGLNVEYQAWQPVHVFINGYHYDVLNMREPNNKHYAYANFGIDTDEMDQFEICPDSGYIQMKGTDESFLRLVELSKTADDETTYEEIRKLLDIDEYINYMAVELYTGNWDWPQNNVKGFRDVNDGKFRFVLFDLDGALSTNAPLSTFFGKQNYTFDTLHGYDYSQGKSLEGKRLTMEIKFVTLFKNLLKNDSFRKQFIDTYCIMGGSVFQPKRVSSIVNEMRTTLSQGNWVWPDNTANDLINHFNTSYANTLTNHLKSYSAMKLTSTVRQNASISSNVSNAKIKLNDIELPYSEFNGYVFAPITLKAEAPVGYQFKGWRTGSTTTSKEIFGSGTTWRYYDQGSLDNADWTAFNTSASNWGTGKTPIGYGKNQTTETAQNLSCYYFRKTFAISEEVKENDEFILDFTIDDGCIVYVNGVEAGRYNMPSGTVNYNTFASSYAQNNPDESSMTLKGSLFKRGTNIIAVEVHNNSATSTDILWDATLTKASEDEAEMEFISYDKEYTLPTSGMQKVVAVFEPIPEADMLAEGITPVRVNEVSAANSMYINDYFKKNDWVELYNTTDKDIDIAGMYISDNAEKPQKYQVPTNDVALNTIIPAHGYKVIWCDKLDNIGSEIHTSFKLATEGGDVLISTENYSDALHYDIHLGTQSFGRYPDGANDTYVMNQPTIAKANQIGSYDELYVKPVNPEPDDIRSYTKEGGITIACVDGVINVKSEDAPIRRVALYNTSGMKVGIDPATRNAAHFITIPVASLPKGIYIATATTEAGDECHIKFYIR